MEELTGFQRDCLYVIAGMDHPKGLAVKDELDAYYAGAINHGRLYPSLDALVEMGLVEKEQYDGRTNTYTVTKEGRQVLQERRTWEDEYIRQLDGSEDITE